MVKCSFLLVLAVWLAASLATGGCGSNSTTLSMDVDGAVVPPDGSAPAEVVFPGDLPELPGDGAAVPDKLADTPLDYGSNVFDQPCTSNADCPTGVCVYTKDGQRCTIPCIEDCPSGWQCRLLPGGPDMLYACVPAHITTCRPCAEHVDCQEFGFQPDGLCYSFSSEQGSFCVTPCSKDNLCPAGFACVEIEGLPNGSQYCLPSSGECGCDQVAVDLGLRTSCSQTSGTGTCSGIRECTEDGLTACDAPLPAPELCDGKDNDCDGSVDEGNPGGGEPCTVSGKKGLCAEAQQECAGGEVVCKQVFFGLDEACDGQDNDCDGQTDEAGAQGCTVYYLDKDSDGYGVDSASSCMCASEGYYTAFESGDCDDTQPAAHPNAGEDCDGIDNDCDGLLDILDPNILVPPCELQAGVCAGIKKPASLCEQMEWKACGPDLYKAIDPAYQDGMEQDCDGLDNDCDGQVDEDFSWFPEECNGVDDDCNGKIDEGLLHDYFLDGDGDLYGDENSKVTACFAPQGTIATGMDCDDSDPTIHPGTEELCDGKDNDCDGLADQFDEACSQGCAEGKRTCTDAKWSECDAPKPLSCVDWESCKYQPMCVAACPPEPSEQCNGLDENCNGEIDEGVLVTFYADVDGDGWGIETATTLGCFPPIGYAAKKGDCADNNHSAYPGAVEVCDNVDNDCDGDVDEGLGSSTCGQGPCKHTVVDCVNGVYTPCDPFEGAQPEACDGIDNDCDGLADEELGTTKCGLGLCEHTVVNCDKGVPQVCNPLEGKQPEVCDGFDNDCDGTPDQIFACPPGKQDVASCGFCGTQTRTCSDTCVWGPYSQCQGQGVCTAGQQQSEPCGQCGTRYRTCNGQCQWDPWGSCLNEGPCSPGQTQNQGCGNCGTQSRSCNAQCQWEPWSFCQNQGVCSVGQQQSQSCGPCGLQYRTCNFMCQWDPWGGCNSTGVCTPGQQQSQSCGSCGTQYRSCNNSCYWDSWGGCMGQGTCTPGQSETKSQSCGSCGTQTSTRSCDWSCNWSAWSSWSSCSGQGVCTPWQTETQSQACGNCGSQSRSRTCSAFCTWGDWGSWSSCSGQGACTPGTVSGTGCDACAQKTCTAACQWSSCALKPGAQCLWEQGTNWKCCGTNKWKFCLSPTYGCVWSSQCVTCTGCGCP